MPNEVLWGYRFVNLLNFRPSAAQYKVDFSAFNAVYKVRFNRDWKMEDILICYLIYLILVDATLEQLGVLY